MVSHITFHTATGQRHAFNIDANVGLNSPNNPLDVQLVQFGYLMMSRNTRLALDEDERAALQNLKVGVQCSGRPDDPLVKVIMAHQKARKGTQDGHVSVIKTTTGIYTDKGQFAYIMVVLNNNMRDLGLATFPRIDQMEGCPTDLKKFIFESYGNPGFLVD